MYIELTLFFSKMFKLSIFISYSGFFINQWVQPTKIKRQSHYFVSKCRYSMSYISLCFRSSLWIFSWLWLLSPFKSRVNQNWKKQKLTKIRLYEYRYIFISIYHSDVDVYCKKKCWNIYFHFIEIVYGFCHPCYTFGTLHARRTSWFQISALEDCWVDTVRVLHHDLNCS